MRIELFEPIHPHQHGYKLAKVWVPAHKRTILLEQFGFDEWPQSEFIHVPDLLFYLFYRPGKYSQITSMYVNVIVDGKEYTPTAIPNGYLVCFGNMIRGGSTIEEAVENCINSYWATKFEHSFKYTDDGERNRFNTKLVAPYEKFNTVLSQYKPVLTNET